MALIGLYVGVIPVAIGMLWLPWVAAWTRAGCASCSPSRSGCSFGRRLLGHRAGRQRTGFARRAALVWLGASRRVPGAGRRGRLAPLAPRAARGRRVGRRRARARLPRRLSGRTRHRAPQPRRGARDRVRLRDQLARPGRGAFVGRLRDPQHDRGPRDRRSGRARGRARLDKLLLPACSRAHAAVLERLDRRFGLPRASQRSCSASACGAIAQVIVQIAPQARAVGAATSPIASAGLLAGPARDVCDGAAGVGLMATRAEANEITGAVQDYAKAIWSLAHRGRERYPRPRSPSGSRCRPPRPRR